LAEVRVFVRIPHVNYPFEISRGKLVDNFVMDSEHISISDVDRSPCGDRGKE
jgi:hypothetical protein